MPTRRFWAMSAMIDPIRAEGELRDLDRHMATQSAENFEIKQRQLVQLIDETREVEINIDPKRDENVKDKLKKALG